MKSVIRELRILLAEALLALARGVMPRDAAESEPLDQALADYAEATTQLKRWEKWPA